MTSIKRWLQYRLQPTLWYQRKYGYWGMSRNSQALIRAMLRVVRESEVDGSRGAHG